MKQLALAMIAAGLTSASLGFAYTAAAAPSGPSNVDNVVGMLESSGYHVIVNRTGTGPSSQCSVDSVRPGQTHKSTGYGDDYVRVVSETVYVDVTC